MRKPLPGKEVRIGEKATIVIVDEEEKAILRKIDL
jgi:hypothetical protein